MLSQALLEKFNEQIGIEFESANLYLQMSSWCGSNGLDGCATFLREHSQEEMEHMFRLFDYVNETGAMAIIPALSKPRSEFETIRDVFETTYKHEQFVTGKINELVHSAFTEHDYSAFNFLQWYVAEQHEEEALFKKVLDLVDMVGTDGQGLFYLDREISSIQATGGTTEAPPAGGA
jgi:ferritin